MNGESVAVQAFNSGIFFAVGCVVAAGLAAVALVRKLFRCGNITGALLQGGFCLCAGAFILWLEIDVAGGTFAPYRLLCLAAGAAVTGGIIRLIRKKLFPDAVEKQVKEEKVVFQPEHDNEDKKTRAAKSPGIQSFSPLRGKRAGSE